MKITLSFLALISTVSALAGPGEIVVTDGPGVKNVSIQGEPARKLVEFLALTQKGDTVGDSVKFTWYGSEDMGCAMVVSADGGKDYFCHLHVDGEGKVRAGNSIDK